MMKFHKYILSILAFVVLSISGHETHAQQLGIKTNALMWAAMTPNFGCEFVLQDRTSLDISVSGHYRPYGLESQFIAIQPEYRFWFNGRPMIREYVGASVMAASYDVTMGGQVYDGIAASVGLTGGYAFLIGNRWRFELCGGLSLLFFNQRQYYRNDDYFSNEFAPANAWGYKLFPAKLGVSFTYIIK
jgi:hypothetical protein